MEHQRGVEADRAERLGRGRDLLGQLRIELDPVPREDPVRVVVAAVGEHDLRAHLGDPFAEHRLRRRHELNRLFDRTQLADEQLLLDCMLGVMPGIHLVSREVDQVTTGGRHVDVQDDTTAQIPEVVVERPPWLVADRLDARLLARRQLDDRRRALAHQGQEVAKHGHGARAVDQLAVAPGLPALVEGAVARQERVELGVGGLVDAHRGLRRPDAVAPFDLVGVRQVIAGEYVRVGGAAAHLIVQPTVGELAQEAVGVGGELRGVNRCLRIDLGLQLRRSVVGVDEPVDMLAEAKAEDEVALGVVHSTPRSNRAAWPWPTPTHIVATP